ncbi:lipase ROG1 [Carex littledalei]|uniref:Lipase ROG1 n=1 Tax=Carex littledalei TaxID=544730 RepID=A0A833VRV4_9POAL|nr:lipase ROG1 [Carex littledalei]
MLASRPMAGTTVLSAGQPRRDHWQRAVTRIRLWGSTTQGQRDRSRWVCCFWSPVVKQKEKVKEKEKEKEKYLAVEPTRGGGEDIWSAKSEAAEQGRFPEHLIIMVNGLVGSAEDWRFAAEQFVKRVPDKVIVHRSECNSAMLTFDGVDLMGERLADEVRSVVVQRRGVQKISFVAHSLGGLVARYAIGRLYEQPSQFDSSINESIGGKGLIAGLVPMNFITFASPHLGSRGNKQLPFLCGLPFLEKRALETAHWIAGRTGKHLFLTDSDDGKPPLLLRMVDDSDDIKFRLLPSPSSLPSLLLFIASFKNMIGS